MFKFDSTTETVLEVLEEEGIRPQRHANILYLLGRVFLKENTVFSFDESVEEEFFLDSEESIDEFIKANHYSKALVIYTVIKIISEKPELKEQVTLFQNNTESWKANLILAKQIEKNEKTKIVTKFIQDIVINLSPILYKEITSPGKDKLFRVLGPLDLNKTDKEYLKELEEEAIKNHEEKLQERQEYGQTVEELQRELSKKEEKIRELEGELRKYKRLAGVSDSLEGAKVLVIGDTRRKESYREVIEKYNGEFEFLDGFKDHALAKEKAEAAYIVFHITAHSSHSEHFQIRNFNNIVYVNNAGVESLEQAVKSQLSIYCNNCGNYLVN